MHTLSENEIKFLKETKFSPTVVQCDEWKRTTIGSFDEAAEAAKAYGVDFDALWENINNQEDWNGLSLSEIAVYLFATFFTLDELESLTDDEAERFLHNWKYHLGFRKFGIGGCSLERDVAKKVLKGEFICKNDDYGGISFYDHEGRNRNPLFNYEIAK